MMDILPEDPEVKKASCFATSTKESWSLAKALGYFSNWHRAKSAVAVCLRYRQKLLEMIKSLKSEADINFH